MNSRLHVAIIMDGNGRWASLRGLARSSGHEAGVSRVREVVEAAADLGIGTLTLFGFSAANWQRPEQETAALLRVIEQYLEAEREECLFNGVRIRVLGRRDRLPARLQQVILRTEQETAAGREFELRLAIDYSSREAIREANGRPLGPDVDLLIRTGGEQRLSDFLLWESAWAELYFTPCLWPDFGGADLGAAVAEFRRRQRRFGALAPVLAGDTMQVQP